MGKNIYESHIRDLHLENIKNSYRLAIKRREGGKKKKHNKKEIAQLKKKMYQVRNVVSGIALV
jgi:hypothetical protein